MERTQAFLAKGTSRRAIIAYFAKLDIPTRTADRYIAWARERWVAERQELAPTMREARLHDLKRLARKLERKEAWAPLATFQKLIVDVEGSRAPEKHEVKQAVMVAQVEPAAALDASVFDDAELAAIKSAATKLMQKQRTLPEHIVGDAQIVPDK